MSATQAHTGSGGAESLRKDLAAIAQFLACEEHHSRVTWKESVLTISDANLAKEKERLKHCLRQAWHWKWCVSFGWCNTLLGS